MFYCPAHLRVYDSHQWKLTWRENTEIVWLVKIWVEIENNAIFYFIESHPLDILSFRSIIFLSSEKLTFFLIPYVTIQNNFFFVVWTFVLPLLSVVLVLVGRHSFSFLGVFVLSSGSLVYSPGCSRTHCKEQAGHELTEICLSLLSEYWK